VVGSALLVLVLIAGWLLPESPPNFPDRADIDRAMIRIRSEQKWPEKIVLDNSKPNMTACAVADPPVTPSSVPLPPDQAPSLANLDSMVQLGPEPQPVTIDLPTLQSRRRVARTARSKHVTRGAVTRRLAKVEAGSSCCQFGWIDSDQTNSNAISRRHVASKWRADWSTLTGRN
jgi:hypothetical protein